MSADDSTTQDWIIGFTTTEGKVSHCIVPIIGNDEIQDQLKTAIDKAVVEDMLDLDLPVMIGDANYTPIIMYVHREGKDPNWVLMDDAMNALNLGALTACLVCGAIKSK